jgi:hypothetical protein
MGEFCKLYALRVIYVCLSTHTYIFFSCKLHVYATKLNYRLDTGGEKRRRRREVRDGIGRSLCVNMHSTGLTSGKQEEVNND